MKKIILSISFALAAYYMNAQIITDTVSLGTGYANQTWYSLDNDNQGTAPKNNWDLAFDVTGQGATILINSITGTTLWNYPNADTSGWSTLDTAGLSTWEKRYNSDTSWAEGAIGRYASPSNPFDLDWGMYSVITHTMTGDSLYVIKLSNNTYKKLWIESLSSGTYIFKYADLNGANLQNATLVKGNYSGQNFGYYSLINNTALSREPVSNNWDLLFTQYTTFIPSAYSVTGILQNKGVHVAEAKPIADAQNYTNYGAHTFKTAINEIGYDWKVFTSNFVIEDSLVYFVKAKNNDIWKVIPTAFGGSANGNFIFTKEKLATIGVKEEISNTVITSSVYPNPSNNDNVNLLVNLEEMNNHNSSIELYDINGKQIRDYSDLVVNSNQLNVLNLNLSDVVNGIYFLKVSVSNAVITHKLIINK